MTQLAGSQLLGMDFSKSQLDSRVPIAFGKANLGNVTWPSFDDRHRMRDAFIIEDLGHADLLSNKPFQHAQFSPYKEFIETVSLGLGCIISGQHSKRPGGMFHFCVIPDNTVLVLSKLESRAILPSLLSK